MYGMKKLIFLLLLSSCTGPFRDKKVYEPDSSAVDPTPRKDTLKLDSVAVDTTVSISL